MLMVGGNIEGHTRVLTTAIVLETSRGRFTIALALGGVLLASGTGRQHRDHSLARATDTMNGIPLLQVRDVTQCHGSVCVLRVGQLDVFAGEIVCLVGPTGSGKTTLLRLLSGLEPPTGGVILRRVPWP